LTITTIIITTIMTTITTFNFSQVHLFIELIKVCVSGCASLTLAFAGGSSYFCTRQGSIK
jgi:hypothetical protein